MNTDTTGSMVVLFASVKGQGMTRHFYNMVVSTSRYANVTAVYDETVGGDEKFITQLSNSGVECVPLTDLGTYLENKSGGAGVVFHCNGFAHVRAAQGVARRGDRILLSVHCFRHALWYAKAVSLLTHVLYGRSVDMWHFLSGKSRDEYFWFRRVPSNTCVFPLGVEGIFMGGAEGSCEIRDVSGRIVSDISSKKNIVYIARFQTWKRQAFLLSSLRSLLKNNTYLYLLGDGATLSSMIDLSERMGIRENVVFTGNLEREKVRYVLQNADLAVTVSPSETFGWCLLEPFCMDVPIVTTDVGIAEEIIQDYRNGFILPKDCSEADFCEKTELALKMFNDIDNSAERKRFTWDEYGRVTARCYSSIMSYRGAMA